MLKTVNQSSYSLSVGELSVFAPMQAYSALPVAYSIYPKLPTGLSLDAKTGVIQGSPTKQAITTTYTITASDGSNTQFALFSISVGKSLSGVDALDIKSIAQSRIALQYRGR